MSSGTKYRAQGSDVFQTGDDKQVLAARMSSITFAFALLYAGLCVLPGYAGSRGFPLVGFMASCRVTESLQGADLELSLVRSGNGNVMMRKLAHSGLFSLVSCLKFALCF